MPRLYFWLFHLLWLFPWSVYFPGVAKLFQAVDRAGQDAPAGALLDRLHPGVLHVFDHAGILFDALLSGAGAAAGSAMAAGGNWIRYGTRVLCAVFIAAAAAVLTLYFLVLESADARRYFRGAQLESGRLQAFAGAHGRSDDRVVRLSARSAAGGGACVSGGSGRHLSRQRRSAHFWPRLVMAVLFFQAARIAMVVFDPYLSSRPLAEALLRSPPGS